MKTNREGSGLFIVILLLSGLMLYTLSIWQATAYLSNISLLRVQYEKDYCATLGLINWAVALTKTNFDALITQPATTLSFKWPPTDKQPSTVKQYNATVEITTDDAKSISLCAQLKDNQENSCVLKARLKRTVLDGDHYQYVLSDWQYE